jgi:hypothetical protein
MKILEITVGLGIIGASLAYHVLQIHPFPAFLLAFSGLLLVYHAFDLMK